MSRALIVINSPLDRIRAAAWCQKAPIGTRIEFKASKRTLPQNSKLWACLTDVATQLPWDGKKRTAETWKFLFLQALKRELEVLPSLDGNGVVNIGASSSDLTKSEMADLIELIHAFGAEHGVKFHDEAEAA